MSTLKLFTDGSVNPQSKVGYGAYLVVTEDALCFESLKKCVKLKRFENTSSTKLELQTLLWALADVQRPEVEIIVFTDSQNIMGLCGRRKRFEQNDYRSKKHRRISNYKLYQAFFKAVDRLECRFVKVRGHKQSRQKDEIDNFFTLVDKASRKALRLGKIFVE